MNALLYALAATGALVWALGAYVGGAWLWRQAKPLRGAIRRTLPGQVYEYLSFRWYLRGERRRQTPEEMVRNLRFAWQASVEGKEWRHPFFVERYRRFMLPAAEHTTSAPAS